MTDEEKKSIEFIEDFKKNGYYGLLLHYDNNRYQANKKIEYSIEIILNLIQKQQLEIEQLKSKIKVDDICLKADAEVIKEYQKAIKNDFIPKSKIEEKIEEYDGLKIMDKTAWEEQVKPLQELLKGK